MVRRSILNTKVTKEASAEKKEENNDSSMSSQNEYETYKDCASVKDKGKKRTSEATEETKGEGGGSK